MKEKKSVFQVIILGVFGFFIVAAVFIFAGLGGGESEQDIGTVDMWGTFDQDLMDAYLNILNDEDSRAGNITYQQHSPDHFQQELVEALADGTGPDLFVLDQAHLLRHWDKIRPISFDAMSERAFKDTFVDEAEMFVAGSGIRGMPFSIDPLVMYWNRDIFSEAGFAKPPEFWDELFLLAERITKKDKANNIERATIAFGEYDNINHAKDIIATLIMQVGGEIVGRLEDGTVYAGLAPQGFSTNAAPAQTALRFYTEFANPVKTVYSWNRSLPDSLDAFAQGDLAMYIGRASELATIQAKNAHLNFDIAPIPQIKAGTEKRVLTFGTLYTLAIPKVADNQFGAEQMLFFLTSPVASQLFSETFGAPSPRRDLLSQTPNDPLLIVFRNAALLSRAWLDPHAEETDRIFRRMVSDVTSGSLRISDTVQRANQELRDFIRE